MKFCYFYCFWKNITEYALQTYDLATKCFDYSFNYQKGLLYGQLGKTIWMIEMFLDEAEAHPKFSCNTKPVHAFMADTIRV
jgi:hypothetical protein